MGCGGSKDDCCGDKGGCGGGDSGDKRGNECNMA